MSDETTNTTTRRSLDELLALETYQGMTDEEIDRVIAFRTAIAKTAAQNEEARKSNQDFIDQMTSRYDEQVTEARAAFDAACSTAATFQVVTLNG